MTAPTQVADPFNDPRTGSGGPTPKIRDLVGRTVIFRPHRIDETTPAMSGPGLSPTVYTDVIVCDGGPLGLGNNQVNGTPNTHTVQIPAKFDNVMDGHKVIVDALREMVGKGVVVGLVAKGDKAFLLQKLEINDPRRAAARDILFAVQSGSFQNPTPVPVNGQATPQYSQPAYAAQTAAPAAIATPQYAPPAPSVAPAADVPVPGFEAVWSTFTEAQKATIRAAHPAAPVNAAPAQPAANAIW